MNKQYMNIEDIKSYIDNRKVIIFGAGSAGLKVFNVLKQSIELSRLSFCDNDEYKQNTYLGGCMVQSVLSTRNEKNDSIYIVPGNLDHKSKNLSEMYAQLKKNNVKEENIVLLDVCELCNLSDDLTWKNTENYIGNLVQVKYKKEKIKKIKHIRSLVFANPPIFNACGGPGRVLGMQKNILGQQLRDLNLEYQFKEDNQISLSNDYQLSSILGAIEFGRKNAFQDNTAYMAHDIFTSFGLAVSGKNYILVYHGQGEWAFENKNLGYAYNKDSEKLIKEIELIAIENAEYVCFPSKGAEHFFWESWNIDKIPQYSRGLPLYNTIEALDCEDLECIDGIEIEAEVLTFLSIGQMTVSKGIDRIPFFLKELSSRIKQNIRWIVVANGPLKDQIAEEMNQLCAENRQLSYAQYDMLKHSQVNYLLSIADIYIMLHRVSIFDLSTLEAMEHKLMVMLSDVKGNDEYNADDNIILISDEVDYDAIATKINTQRNYLSEKNYQVFTKNFNEDMFKKRYTELILNMVDKVENR